MGVGGGDVIVHPTFCIHQFGHAVPASTLTLCSLFPINQGLRPNTSFMLSLLWLSAVAFVWNWKWGGRVLSAALLPLIKVAMRLSLFVAFPAIRRIVKNNLRMHHPLPFTPINWQAQNFIDNNDIFCAGACWVWCIGSVHHRKETQA